MNSDAPDRQAPDELHASRMFGMQGRHVVVTGAASGLGRAIAQVMAANGASLTLIDSAAVKLLATTSALQKSATPGQKIVASAFDITDTDALAGTMEESLRLTGRIDAVFANAGISAGPGFGSAPQQAIGRLDQIDASVWERVLTVNLTSVMHTIRLASAPMKTQREGRIIVTASIAGMRAEPFCGYAYAAAKGAVVNLIRQAATELAPHGVMVNGIAPGFLHTDIGGGRLDDAAVREALAGRVPMGRVAAASEIGGLALFLASPACTYVTGTVIPVDGGILAT